MPDEETQKAIGTFLKEYGELVAKHKVDFVTYPLWQPDGKGGWEMKIQTQAMSTKELPVISPFVEDVKKN